MSSRSPAVAFILLLLIASTQSHKRGEEYTYMSMFVKPQTPDMIEGDNHLGRIYEQLSVHPSKRFAPLSRARRSLSAQYSNNEEEEEEEEEEDTEEEEQDTSDSSAASQSQQNNEPLNQPLSRMSMSEESKVSVKLSDDTEEEEDDEEEEEETLEREKIPPSAEKVRMKVDEEEKKDKQSSEHHISEHLGKKYGENLQRLQSMLLKIILNYDIESMADVPCRAHAHWMPLFLDRLAKKKKNFRYYCVDTRKDVLKSVKQTIGQREDSKFILRRFWRQGIPRADLVFSWSGLDNMKPKNVKKYLTRLSKTGKKHKLIAIGSHFGKLQKQGDEKLIARFTAGGRPINVRQKPFQLKRPMRIIGDLSTEGNDKQLYLYKANEMMD